MAHGTNPYGDGAAAERIVGFLEAGFAQDVSEHPKAVAATRAHTGTVPLIRDARDDEVEAMRRLLRDYERSIGIDLCFQGFEDELENLPGEYVAAVQGAFLVADDGDDLVGCVALRALSAESCEMKRLYVDPRARGSGLGRQLVESVLDRARSFGYEKMLLATLPSMQTAQALTAGSGLWRRHRIGATRSQE
jgi:N-acetylglutamate synthase-like GNAT family acetyltransferase